MHFDTLALTSVLALATTATAASQWVVNHCVEPLWLTLTDSQGQNSVPIQVNTTVSYTQTISGTGTAIAITKSADYWSSPKAIFAASTSNNVLYWTLSSVGGDPFAGEAFNVTTGGVAEETAGYGSQVFSGADGEEVKVVFSGCWHRA